MHRKTTHSKLHFPGWNGLNWMELMCEVSTRYTETSYTSGRDQTAWPLNLMECVTDRKGTVFTGMSVNRAFSIDPPSFVLCCTFYCMTSVICNRFLSMAEPGLRFNIEMPSYQYRKPHCGDNTVVRSSYLHNGISYTGEIASLYWIGAQVLANERIR